MTRWILLAGLAVAGLSTARPALALVGHPYLTSGAWMAELRLPGVPPIRRYVATERACRELGERLAYAGGARAVWRCRIVERG